MTTIAYRDGVLVCDGQVTRNNTIIELNGRKWHVCKDGTCIAFAGDLMKFLPFIDWVEAGRNHDNVPSLKFNNDDSCQAIVMTDQAVYEYDKDGFHVLGDEYCAWGSGAYVALTAMVLGMSAYEAVIVATKLDIYTGGTINVMRRGHGHSISQTG